MKSSCPEENLALTQKILSATSVEELKTVGAYLKVKAVVETTLCVKLGVRGWTSLFTKLQAIQGEFNRHRVQLQSLVRRENSGSRKTIENLLGIAIKSRNFDDLRTIVNHLNAAYKSEFEEEVAFFEETKRHNFKHSSRLEGIRINYSEPNETLESVLAKHRRTVNG